MVELLIIGDEILNGRISDKNGPWLSSFLFSKGLPLKRITSIRDEIDQIIAAILEAKKRSTVLILSGGLGPTLDDVTKDALGKLLNKPLTLNQNALEVASLNYQRNGRDFNDVIPKGNKYHYLPEGILPLNNPLGYAPGLMTTIDNTQIFCAPGVPREFKAMVEEEFLPLILKKHKITKFPIQVTIRTRGIPEEKIFNEVVPNLWEELSKKGQVSSYPQVWGIDIVVTLEDSSDKKIPEEIYQILKDSPLHPYVWQYGNQKIEEFILQLAKEKNLKISCVESCTGGLIASRLTNISGSSESFLGSATTYSNEAKINLLKVKELSLKNKGAVSHEVAQEMALGGNQLFHSDICVSTTGIAGPTGGSDEKPVGTIFIGISKKGKAESKNFEFRGDRLRLKEIFSQQALFLLLEKIKEGPY